jgi:signal transduction histidine kinase
MSGTSSSPRDLGRLVDLTTALVVCALLCVMVLMPAQETLPYHLLFLVLTIVYGYRVWPLRPTLAVVGLVTLATGAVFYLRWSDGVIESAELIEILLMPALVLAMVWHARRRARAELAAASMAEDLRQVLERERAFLSDSSHAIKTPVTIARGHMDLLLPELDGIAREDAAVVLRQLSRMERLSGRLLSLAHLENGDTVASRLVDIDAFVAGVAREWRAVERAWDVDIDSSATVRADPEWLHMALDALVENAVKHTQAGDRLGISCRLAGGTVVVTVDDDGPGVPAADQPHVFERFWHRRSAGQPAGSGLGLAMVRAVAEAHGGCAEVEQSPWGGARFNIRLPLVRPPAAVTESVPA